VAMGAKLVWKTRISSCDTPSLVATAPTPRRLHRPVPIPRPTRRPPIAAISPVLFRQPLPCFHNPCLVSTTPPLRQHPPSCFDNPSLVSTTPPSSHKRSVWTLRLSRKAGVTVWLRGLRFGRGGYDPAAGVTDRLRGLRPGRGGHGSADADTPLRTPICQREAFGAPLQPRFVRTRFRFTSQGLRFWIRVCIGRCCWGLSTNPDAWIRSNRTETRSRGTRVRSGGTGVQYGGAVRLFGAGRNP
jgi:hypothetical protein